MGKKNIDINEVVKDEVYVVKVCENGELGTIHVLCSREKVVQLIKKELNLK